MIAYPSSPDLRAIDFKEGVILLVDKPAGWTSFDVVNKIRYRLKRITASKQIKVGHGGTLDPLATGLLIIATGKKTKQLPIYIEEGKAYTGTLFLGATTPSYDAETVPDALYDISTITPERIETARQQLTGEIYQAPPMFSAIKVDGKPLYQRAREGQTLEVPLRKVVIRSFLLSRIALPEIDFEVECSKGTYIRSLVHDFGKLLDAGAYLQRLVRIRSGAFSLSDAWQLDALIQQLDAV